MDLTIQKCNPRGAQCEQFIKEVETDFCPKLQSNIVVGDAFTKFTEPPFRCPIKAGKYVASKMLVNMTRFDLLPFDDKSKWTVWLAFYQRFERSVKEPLGCWFLQFSRTTGSNKKRGKGK